ncbi:MAG: transposase, partial [Oscillospiraceae bacterium]|nr:transposase [Oscillospiraceae bacterium]
MTFKEFRTRFSTEEICRAELFRLRFPNGFVCPKCGCTEYYPVRG